MHKIYLEYAEEDINFADSEELETEAYNTIKNFMPLFLYKNPVENVDIQEINVDFDPSELKQNYLHCTIVSYFKEETETEAGEAFWFIPYVCKTRREALVLQEKIQLDQIENSEFPWTKKGYQYNDVDTLLLHIED